MALPNKIRLPRPHVSGLPSIQNNLLPQPKLPQLGRPVYRPKPFEEYESLVFDYNDPDEVNSLADVMYRHIDRAYVKGQGPRLVNALFDIDDVAADTWDLVKGTFSPAFQGQVDTTGMNILINFMETMDLVANPIKGAIMEGFEGFKKGTIGRKNYDFDTGFVGTDMIAEALIDPLNWITLGAKAGVSTAAKETAQALIKEVGSSVADRKLRRLATTLFRSMDDTSNIGKFLKESTLLKDLSMEQIQKLEKLAINNAANSTLLSVSRAAGKAADFVDSNLLQAGLYYTPKLASPLAKRTKGMIFRQLRRVAEKYIPGKQQRHLFTNYLDNADGVKAQLESFATVLDEDIPNNEFLDALSHKYSADDYKQLREIFQQHSGDAVKLKEAIDEFVEGGGKFWRDYKTQVEGFAQTAAKQNGVHRLLRVVNAIDEAIELGSKYTQAAKDAELSLPALKAGLEEYQQRLTKVFQMGQTGPLDAKAVMRRLDDVYSTETLFYFLEDVSDELRFMQDSPLWDTYVRPIIERMYGGIPNAYKLERPDGRILFDSTLPELSPAELADIKRTIMNQLAEASDNFIEEIRRVEEFLLQAPSAQLNVFDTAEQLLSESAMLKKAEEVFKQIRSSTNLVRQAEDLTITTKSGTDYLFAANIEEAYRDLDAFDELVTNSALHDGMKERVLVLTDDFRGMIDEKIMPIMSAISGTDAVNDVAVEHAKIIADFNRLLNELVSEDDTMRKLVSDLSARFDNTRQTELRSLKVSTVDKPTTVLKYDNKEFATVEDALKYEYDKYKFRIEQEVAAGNMMNAERMINQLNYRVRSKISEYTKTPTIYRDEILRQVQVLDPATQELITRLGEYTDMLDDIAEITYEQVDMDSDQILYALQLGLHVTSNMLYSSPGLPKLMDTVDDTGVLNAILGIPEKLMPSEAKQAAAEIYTQLEAMRQTIQLNDTVMKDDILDPATQVALWDTLNHSGFARRKLSNVQDRDFLIANIIEHTQGQVRNRAKEQYNLGSLIYRDWEGFKAYAKENNIPVPEEFTDFKTTLHDARTDVLATAYIAEKQGIDLTNGVVWDLETLGLEGSGADSIVQISYKLPGQSEIRNIVVKPFDGMYPKDDVMRTLLGKGHDAPISQQELMDEFDVKFRNNPEAISEDEAIRIFLEDVDSLASAQEVPKLVGQNIRDFDIPMLRARAKKYDQYLPTYYDVEDTYLKALDKDGIKLISDAERERIYDMMHKYLEYRADAPVFHAMLDVAGEGTVDFATLGRTLMETPNDVFMANLRTLSRAIDDVDKGLMYAADSTRVLLEASQQYKEVLDGVGTSLGTIRGINRDYNKTIISTRDIEEIMGQLDEQFDPNLDAANVMKILGMDTGDADAFYVVPKKILDTNHIRNHYYGISGKHGIDVMSKMKQTSDSIANWYRAIKDITPMIDRGMDFNVAQNLFNGFKSILRDSKGTLPEHLELLQLNPQDMRMAFAQLKYLYTLVNSTGSGRAMQLVNGLGENKGIFEYLEQYSQLDRVRKIIGTESEEKFFSPSFLNEEMEAVYRSNTAARQNLEKLDSYTDEFTLHGITNQRLISMLEHFQTSSQLMDDMHNYYLKLKATAPKEVTQLISDTMNYGNGMALQQLGMVFGKDAKALYSRLYHDAFGVMTFRLDDLQAARISVEKFNEITKGIKELGATVELDGKQVYMYIDADTYAEQAGKVDLVNYDDYYDLSPLPRAKQRVKALEDLDLYNRTRELREEVLAKKPEAVGTTMETFSEQSLVGLHRALPEKITKKLPTADYFRTTHRFEKLNFNNSVLGLEKYRRAYAPHTFKNPAKTLHGTMQILEAHTATQVKYTQAMFADNYRLTGPILKDLSDQDLLDMINGNKGLAFGWLETDKKYGYLLKQTRPVDIKSIQVLREFDPVIYPKDFLDNAEGVINKYNITNEMVQMFDKYFVGASKVGQLTSIGFLFRNLIDSVSKITFSAGDVSMITHLFDTIKSYMKYESINKAIIEQFGTYNKDVVLEIFGEGKSFMDLSLDDYLEINHFMNDGASAGMSQVIQEEYMNVYKKLARTVPESSGLQGVITPDLIQQYIEKPHLLEANPPRPEVLAELERLSRNFDSYHKAIEMSSSTRNRELSTDAIMQYMKFPATIPEHLKKEYDELFDKVKVSGKTRKNVDKMIFDNPISRKLFTANTHLEHVVRLSDYTYQRMYRGLDQFAAGQHVVETSFDMAHKKMWQKYLEILMPFSTFQMQNFMYFAQLIGSQPSAYRFMANVGMPIFNLDEYDQWDLDNRRSLQYQIMAGNPILNRKTGLNLKLSPAVMDAFGILTDPAGTIPQRLSPLIRVPSDVIKSYVQERPEWMDQEYINRNNLLNVTGAIPLLGPVTARTAKGIGYAQDVYGKAGDDALSKAQALGPAAMSSVFGRTNLPQPKPEWKPRKWRKYYPRWRSDYYTRYTPKKYQPSPKQAYYSVLYNNPRDMPAYNVAMRKINNIRKRDMFTKSGKHKLSLMMIPPKPGSAAFTLRHLR